MTSGRCGGRASGSAVVSWSRSRRGVYRVSTEPPSVGCHGRSRSTDCCHAASSVGPKIDRAPRRPSRSPVTANCPSPDDEGEALRLQTGCRDDPQRHVPRIDRQPISELDDLVRQGTCRHRGRRAPRCRVARAATSAPPDVIGLGARQGDRRDPPSAPRRHLRWLVRERDRSGHPDRSGRSRAARPGTPRPAGRLPRRLPASRSGRSRPRSCRPRPRSDDLAPFANAPPSIEVTWSSCTSVVDVGSHMASSSRAIDASASTGRCQACA